MRTVTQYTAPESTVGGRVNGRSLRGSDNCPTRHRCLPEIKVYLSAFVTIKTVISEPRRVVQPFLLQYVTCFYVNKNVRIFFRWSSIKFSGIGGESYKRGYPETFKVKERGGAGREIREGRTVSHPHDGSRPHPRKPPTRPHYDPRDS